ncbi:unnamed protein product [Linum trigynum]|uniref:Uncharacterized protein n=1 Tax=Linum trigynum TaxID=586398 RepID=A0AAV2GG04_9ROSI
MGSDRKSRDEEKRKKKSNSSRKRSSSPSSAEDAGKSRKRGRNEDGGDGRDSKKEKRTDSKSRSHRPDKEKKSKDRHDAKHHKGDDKLRSDFTELSADDYFAKNNEFATWLAEKKKVFFSDLSSESAREMFADFVKAWNKQKLDSKYYDGISSGPRTAHNWKIKR